MPAMTNERLTYTVEEAARLLGIGRGTAYEAARTGQLPTVPIGRRLLVPRHKLHALLGEPDTEGVSEGGEPPETPPHP
jgi:excisionase family DNA binding protein